MARAFPTLGQQKLYRDPADLFAGSFYARDFNEKIYTAFIAPKPDVSQVTTAQVNANNLDLLQLMRDSLGPAPIVSTADDEATAQLIEAAWEALIPAPIQIATNGTGLMTITDSDFEPHVYTSFSPATADITGFTIATPASTSPKIGFGFGVTGNTAYPDLISQTSRVVDEPIGPSSKLAGIMAYQIPVNFPAELLALIGLDPSKIAYLPSGFGYTLVSKGRMVVSWVGTLPTTGFTDVHWINDPAVDPDNLMSFRSDVGGGAAVPVPGAYVEGVLGDNLVKVNFTQELVG